MKTPLFSIFNAAVLNHLLNQQPWTRDQLCQLAGKIVCLRVPPLSLHLLIESNGAFAALRESEENAPDATLTLAAAAAARFALTRQLDVAEICIQGDYETGSAVGRVLRSLEWDAEEDMSRLVGDIAAHKIMQLGANALAETRRQATSLGGMLVEYWQEENPLIAKRHQLENFAAQVDLLRNAAERLAKRIEKLEQPR